MNTDAKMADSLTEKFEEAVGQHAPSYSMRSPTTIPSAPVAKAHLFGRTQTVHEIFGSGPLADLLMWKKWKYSAAILGGVTIVWILFEWSGYRLITVLANAAIAVIVTLFVWTHAASRLNRAPPPLPELELSEELVQSTAKLIRSEVNKALSIGHDIALGKDFRKFLKVIVALFVLSKVGAWFNFLTLVFMVIVMAFTLPYVYEKYEDIFDKHGEVAVNKAGEYYKLAEERVLSRIPRAAPKDKKSQ
eukprot:TRINITY_DN226_c0_g1_i1.p1 TRINITY_DN226_c0_g1~~TRINITY_DN226_c0_g1_i1.p1  ORF type:complete len:247 (+),score=50.91 TRINITY_DN226_c0_g1_i1:134-874(+)